jgi:AcrR family transcriptional regulator
MSEIAPDTKAPPRRRMRKDLRRQTILLAATRALAESGPEGVSMGRVASMLGISRTMLYDHFASRAELLVAIHDDYARFLQEKVSAAVAGNDRDLNSLARASVRGFLDAVAERGVFNRRVLRIGAAEPDVRDSQRRLWRFAVDGTIARVRPLVGPVDEGKLRLAASMTISLMVQAATMWLEGECTREQAEDIYVTMAVPALSALASGRE